MLKLVVINKATMLRVSEENYKLSGMERFRLRFQSEASESAERVSQFNETVRQKRCFKMK